MKNQKAFEKAMEEKKVMKGTIKLVQFDKELNTDILGMDLDGVKAVIVREEVDVDLNWRSLVNFLGREVHYTIKSIDLENGIVYCSRKEAQQLTKDGVVKRLEEGEVANGQIINILKYGAYVEIDGVTGLLKNQDFADDYTAIGDVKKIGEKINIRLRKVSESGRLLFEAVEKHSDPTIMGIDMFERDQIVFGMIRNVKPWGVFVRIAPNLDALCSIPPTGEIEEGMKVSFRITQVDEEQGRVRGKILRVLS